MTFVKTGYISFLVLMNLVDVAFGIACLYYGVTLHLQFAEAASDPQNVYATTANYFAIGLMIVGSITVLLGLLSMLWVCRIRRYVLIQETVKSFIYSAALLGILIGLGIYLPNLLIYIESIYIPEYAQVWLFFEVSLNCCGPANTTCSTERCNDVLTKLLVEGKDTINIVVGILLGVEILAMSASIYLLCSEQYEEAERQSEIQVFQLASDQGTYEAGWPTLHADTAPPSPGKAGRRNDSAHWIPPPGPDPASVGGGAWIPPPSASGPPPSYYELPTAVRSSASLARTNAPHSQSTLQQVPSSHSIMRGGSGPYSPYMITY